VTTLEMLQGMLVAQLGVDADRVTPDARLVEDLEASELDLVNIWMQVGEVSNLSVPDGIQTTITTVGQMVSFIDASTSGGVSSVTLRDARQEPV